MTLTQIDSQTKTAAFTGTGIDVSGLTGDWTIKLNVSTVTPPTGQTAVTFRLAVEDTVNDFTGSITGPVISMANQIGPSYDKVKSFRKADFPDLRCGTASAQLRLKLATLTAGASITYRGWLEY